MSKRYTRGKTSYYEHEFQTPMSVAYYMASLVPRSSRRVLEPTPGRGNIVKALTGFDVTAPNDYFLLPAGNYDSIVMNPPFSRNFAKMENAPEMIAHKGMKLGYWFLWDCLKRSDNVIALMPWFTISDSDLRLRHLKNYGLKSITALPRKTFDFARIQTMILECVKGYRDETTFRVFEMLNLNEQKIF